MRRVSCATLAAVAVISYVSVASAAPPTVYSWTGFYIGGNFGYGWDNASVGIAPDASRLPFINETTKIPSTLATRPKGWLAGVQAGYNYQINMAVFGVEADISLADISGNASETHAAILPLATFTTSAEQRLKEFGTLRGRVGFTPFNSLLIYGTGGLAFGRIDNEANIIRADTHAGPAGPALSFQFPASTSVTKTGWTVGGGAEYALSNRWSVKGEYLYYDLGETTLTGVQPPKPPALPAGNYANYNFVTRGSIVRLGLNIKIN